MSQDYHPSLVPFDPKECGTPMIEAVNQLAGATGQDVSSFNGRTLTEIFQLADDTYDELPEFWCIWKEWHAPQPKPEMGDL